MKIFVWCVVRPAGRHVGCQTDEEWQRCESRCRGNNLKWGKNGRMQQVAEMEVTRKQSSLGGGVVWAGGQEKQVIGLGR